MENKAISTLMMVSDESFFPRNWENQLKTPSPLPQTQTKKTNAWTNYQYKKHKDSGLSKESPDKRNEMKAGKESKTALKPNHIKSHLFTTNNNFRTWHKKAQQKHQLTQILKKKYILQNFKSLGKLKTVTQELLPPHERKQRVNSEAPHQINIPLVSETTQTHHCFRNQIIKQLLEEKSTYLTQLKSKINPSFNKSTIVIYSRKKTHSTHQPKERKLNRVNTTVVTQSYLSKQKNARKQSKSKNFFIKNPELHKAPKNLFKVYSLSII